MATAKGNWKLLINNLEVRWGPVNPVPLSILSKYEKERKFILPHSYCGYCNTFGPGEIDGGVECRIYVPFAEEPQLNIDHLNNLIKQMAITGIANVDQFIRAVFFGSTRGAHFFWDPNDTTDDSDIEYGVYALNRDNTVERLSDYFYEFINNYCIADGVPNEDYKITFTPGR